MRPAAARRSSTTCARTARRSSPQSTTRVGGFPNDLVDALWELVWQGVDHERHVPRAARVHTRRRKSRRSAARAFRSRRTAPPSTQGRWSLVPQPTRERDAARERAGATAPRALRRRHARGAAARERPGGFSAVYPVLKAMEEAGRIRRGYFVAGLGATQFATRGRGRPAALVPRRARGAGDLMLAATDPANPYGAIVKWPASPGSDAQRRRERHPRERRAGRVHLAAARSS